MMSSEIATAVAEGVKLIVVLVVNHGFASIGALSETVGVNRFGTWYRDRDGANLPTDLAANAASLGADTISVADVDGLRAALATAQAATGTTVIQIETDPLVGAPDSEAWWDVPVAEVSRTSGTEAARAAYEKAKQAQRNYL
jgi:3D-(3,5/4)-trihydroxycyclohexane-1,2-dione acylhydrolase (decyclizing)